VEFHGSPDCAWPQSGTADTVSLGSEYRLRRSVAGRYESGLPFRPFPRASLVGGGIGFALVKGLIELHGAAGVANRGERVGQASDKVQAHAGGESLGLPPA